MAYQLQRRMAPGLCQRWGRALALARAGAPGAEGLREGAAGMHARRRRAVLDEP